MHWYIIINNNNNNNNNCTSFVRIHQSPKAFTNDSRRPKYTTKVIVHKKGD